MSDFRCEWQALHGPRCSHQCNECKDNDTPPEPRMTSERQETPDFKQADELARSAEAWAEDGSYNATMALARAYLTLRATPRAVPDETREALEEAMRDRIIEKAGLDANDCDVDSADPADHVAGGIDAMRRSLDTSLGLAMDDAARLAAHPPRAGEVTEEQPFGDYDAGEAHKLALYFAQMQGARGSLGRGYLNLAALGRPS